MTLSTINTPIHLSADSRVTPAISATERTRINSVIFLLAFTCLTERVGLNLGKFPFPCSLSLVPAVVGLLILLGFFRIDRRTILIYGGYVCSVMFSTALNGGSAYLKPTAIVLHLALALIFCVCAPLGEQA